MRFKSFASLKLLSNEAGSVTRLTLLERLGLGPQAEVWLARDQLLGRLVTCLLYTSPSPRDRTRSRMPSSA